MPSSIYIYMYLSLSLSNLHGAVRSPSEAVATFPEQASVVKDNHPWLFSKHSWIVVHLKQLIFGRKSPFQLRLAYGNSVGKTHHEESNGVGWSPFQVTHEQFLATDTTIATGLQTRDCWKMSGKPQSPFYESSKGLETKTKNPKHNNDGEITNKIQLREGKKHRRIKQKEHRLQQTRTNQTYPDNFFKPSHSLALKFTGELLKNLPPTLRHLVVFTPRPCP